MLSISRLILKYCYWNLLVDYLSNIMEQQIVDLLKIHTAKFIINYNDNNTIQ